MSDSGLIVDNFSTKSDTLIGKLDFIAKCSNYSQFSNKLDSMQIVLTYK